jgi:hypothetical protein
MAIIAWYTITTPLIMQRYAAIQELEREAAGAATEALSSVRMIAAYGAEDKISATYNKLVDKTSTKSKELSPILASQHSPGTYAIAAKLHIAKQLQCSLQRLQLSHFVSGLRPSCI